ncbi:MAG: hypothetical protein ACYC2H_00065 [Thermoplasmatota archaeon]
MTKLPLLLGIMLTMTLMASNVQAVYVAAYNLPNPDPCIEDLCILDDGCQEGHRSSPPRPTYGEIGYPDPPLPGWYIMCL